MDKKLTTALINDINTAGLSAELCWDSGITNLKHVLYMQSLGLSIPPGVIPFLQQEGNFVVATDATLESPATDNYGREYFIDSINGLAYYKDLIYEGCGVNGSTSTLIKRYNGMAISPQTGVIFKDGARVEFVKVTKQDTNSARDIDLMQCDPNGSNPENIGQIHLNEFGNRYGETLTPMYIQPGKRLYFDIDGGTITNLQIRLAYREGLPQS